MGKIFEPIKDLFGAVYDLVFDSLQKVLSLAKPVLTVGLLFDLVTGKLGWISQILEVYQRVLSYTAGASWLVVAALVLIAIGYFQQK